MSAGREIRRPEAIGEMRNPRRHDNGERDGPRPYQTPARSPLPMPAKLRLERPRRAHRGGRGFDSRGGRQDDERRRR